MTRLTQLTELLYFKGKIVNKEIRISELDSRNNSSDFVIIISMMKGE